MPRRAMSDAVQLKIRTKEPLRAMLEKAAKERGVSMNQEIIDRLQKSAEYDRRIEEIFGGHEIYDLVRIIAAILAATLHRKEGDKLLDDPARYDRAVSAVTNVLKVMRPGYVPTGLPPDALAALAGLDP